MVSGGRWVGLCGPYLIALYLTAPQAPVNRPAAVERCLSEDGHLQTGVDVGEAGPDEAWRERPGRVFPSSNGRGFCRDAPCDSVGSGAHLVVLSRRQSDDPETG